MTKPHEASARNRAAKRLAPVLAHAVRPRPIRDAVRLGVHYLNILQGLGSGTGWDLRSEAQLATQLVRRPRPVIIDVGANVGEWACAVSAMLGELQPTILAVEPSPGCQAELHRRQIPNTIVVARALGARNGSGILHADSPTSPIASLHARRDSYFESMRWDQAEPVEIITLDDLIHYFDIEAVDLVKIDTEGHDYHVLEGASEALSSNRVRTLTFEFGSGQINSRTFFHDFWDLLTPSGYRLWRIAPGGSPIPVHTYYEDLEYFRGVSNYVAVAPSIALPRAWTL